MATLGGKTIIMSGGSRGIGLAIAKSAAADGANITLISKTDAPHPSLPGTIHTAAQELEDAGGRAHPIVGDIRDDETVSRAVAETAERFGGIDIVVNNASAIDLSGTEDVAMKRYDLMQDVNTRGTFLLSKLSIPHLRRSAANGRDPHILSLSPPLNLAPEWVGRHLAYTLAKYGMSLTTIGLAEELKNDGIAVSSLWPRTTIATAAIRNIVGGEQMMAASRTPQIVADAARELLAWPGDHVTGRFFIDDEVLAQAGVRDFDEYRVVPGGGELEPDMYLD